MPKASVKVMRSYDYCHFEVCLGTDDDIPIFQINELRKDAARLVDEAVRQYQIAKERSFRQLNQDIEKKDLLAYVREIKAKPESEWTAVDKARVKAFEDQEHWKEYDYDYEDDIRD